MGTSEHVPLPTDEAKAKELEQSQHSEEPDRWGTCLNYETSLEKIIGPSWGSNPGVLLTSHLSYQLSHNYNLFFFPKKGF